MKVERLVIGTGNKAKVVEWTEYLNHELPDTQIVGAGELGIFEDPQESGETFEENARIKASSYARQFKEFVMSEDGGYEVDALDGAPGVKSRRILPGGKEATDQEMIDFVLEKLRGLAEKERGVSLTTAIAVSDPEGNIIYEDISYKRGVVSQTPGPVHIEGYPFREIHYLPELGKTYAELTEEERRNFGHKAPMAKRLAEFLASEE